jgi:tRNA nucleotidyltransferase (CCA-adding enzyme)
LYLAGEEISISVERIYQVLNRNEDIERINDLKKRYQDLVIKERGDLAITGQDLMSWMEESGGPWVKELIEKTEQAVLMQKVPNEKDAIREWLYTCNLK